MSEALQARIAKIGTAKPLAKPAAVCIGAPIAAGMMKPAGGCPAAEMPDL